VATTTAPLPVAAKVQQEAAVMEPRQPATEVGPQQPAVESRPPAPTTVALTVPPTSPAPATTGGPAAAGVEIPDDNGAVPPLGWD
jgi:hypothetical protein